MNSSFKKMMNKYCERIGKEQSDISFIYDGYILNQTQTPKLLKMKDMDEITVAIQQVGGFKFNK